MLNELIGIINPDDKEFSEQIATMVYRCLMKVYTEATAILGADIVGLRVSTFDFAGELLKKHHTVTGVGMGVKFW